MKTALAKATIKSPVTPLVANVIAREAESPAQIRELLVEQVTGRVRWTESVTFMAEKGCDTFIEIGSGKVLAGLIKRNAKDMKTLSLGEPGDIDVFAAV